jgi:hypothetical protein
MRAFREKFGELGGDQIGARLASLVQDFLTHEPKAEAKPERRHEPQPLGAPHAPEPVKAQ